jgi:hypothetical protein
MILGLLLLIKHYSGDQIKEDEMGGACDMHGREEKCIQDVGWKPEGNRALGRPMHRWENIIKMDFKEINGM